MRRSRPSSPFYELTYERADATDYFAEVDGAGRRLPPDLFRSLRRFRRVRIRLIVEVILLAAATVLMFLVPNLGQIVLAAILGIVTLYDVLLYLHLRRQIRDAWQDLVLLSPE